MLVRDWVLKVVIIHILHLDPFWLSYYYFITHPIRLKISVNEIRVR